MKTGIETGYEGTRRMHDTAQFGGHTLSNGIVVWLQKPTVLIDHGGYLSVFFKGVGSFMDPPGLRGLAHYVEHAVFCGSKSSPSLSELVNPVLDNGGNFNAFTSNVFTEYWCTISQQYFRQAAKMLAELLTDPLFDPQDIRIERDVIIREIKDSYKVKGKRLITEHSREFIFGKGHPVLRSIAGYPSTVEKITAADIEGFFKKHYHAGNANIVCGGSFSVVPNILGMLEEFFGGMRGGSANPLLLQPFKTTIEGLHTFQDKRYGVDSLSLAYPMPQIPYPQRVAPWILFESLAETLTSPLLIELREKRGMVYGVTSKLVTSLYGSLAGMECYISTTRFAEAERIFRDMLKSIDAKHFARYMGRLQKERLIEFQHPVNACREVADDVILNGRSVSWHEHAEFQDAITVEELLAWRDHFLAKEPLVIHFVNK